MIALLLWLATSNAATCPWNPDAEEPLRVEAHMTTVTVDDTVYVVRGRVRRREFEAVLRSCDQEDAVIPFRAWRAQRRLVNITAGAGLTALWPVLAATPSSAVAAGVYKRQMVRAMEGD